MSTNLRTVKNILVTGGAGFIGSAFVRYLLKGTFEGKLIVLDALTYAGTLDNLKEVEGDSRYVFCEGDICNQKLVEHLICEHEIDTIIHFAAESHVDRSIDGPMKFIETNVLGTFHLLEAVRKNPHVHFHHVSTDEVFGCLSDEGKFSECSPMMPNSPYSASKAASDHFVRAYTKTYGISTCTSHCSNNFGPYQYPEKLIPLMIQKCLMRRPLPVYGNGRNVRDWLYVDDHVEALWQLLLKGKRGETYNIGGDAEWRNIDIVKELMRIVAEETECSYDELEQLITFVKDRPGHDYRYAIDSSKIQSEIGWTPKHTFSEGLRSTVKWYTRNSKVRA